VTGSSKIEEVISTARLSLEHGMPRRQHRSGSGSADTATMTMAVAKRRALNFIVDLWVRNSMNDTKSVVYSVDSVSNELGRRQQLTRRGVYEMIGKDFVSDSY